MQRHQQQPQTTYEHFNQKEALFDRKVDLITSGLQPRFGKYLRDSSLVSNDNAVVICDYVLAMNTEINPSNNYRRTTIQLLIQLSKFVSKPFNLMTREDVIGFLDNLRKPESLDPLHKQKRRSLHHSRANTSYNIKVLLEMSSLQHLLIIARKFFILQTKSSQIVRFLLVSTRVSVVVSLALLLLALLTRE